MTLSLDASWHHVTGFRACEHLVLFRSLSDQVPGAHREFKTILSCIVQMAASVMRPHRVLRSSGILLRNNKRLCTVEEHTSVVKLTNTAAFNFVFNLPDELLDDILPHVDSGDLCSLSQVCRRLNKLAVRLCFLLVNTRAHFQQGKGSVNRRTNE